MKLSIIIPYYKNYDLTCELLDALIPQLNKKVEVILVDDGCHEYRLDKYKKINIIHLEENKGVSTARNTGLKKATGEYIAFIDSDDLVSNDYISTLLSEIDGTDVIYFNWKFKDGATINLKNGIPDWNYAVWKAIYRKEICPRFNEELRKCEDVPFQQELTHKIANIKFIDKTLYQYYGGRKGSLTNG